MSGRVARSGFTVLLLRCGVLVGPLYLAVGIVQGLVREGFDFGRHPLSVLANGTGGWIQTTNFAVCGIMVVASAVGIARALRPSGRVGSCMLGCYGAGMIVAAGFPMDPVDGFPSGTPLGPPTAVSTSGVVHFAAGSLGFLALGVSCLALAFVLRRRRDSQMALLSLLSGMAVLGGFFGPFVVPGLSFGMAGIWFAVVVGWAWLAVLSLHLSDARRGSPTTSSRG